VSNRESKGHLLVDIKREPPKKTKRNVLIAAGGIGLIFVTVALSRLEARPPSVNRAEVIIDSVKRGELVRQVRAPGSLVPENIRYAGGPSAKAWRSRSTARAGSST
jgi:hypothetical protein